MIIMLLCVFAGFDIGDQDKQYNHIESSPLLILLVTSLIICLLIVVIFFVIRLRRAHIAWKKGIIRLFIDFNFDSSFIYILMFSCELILDAELLI